MNCKAHNRNNCQHCAHKEALKKWIAQEKAALPFASGGAYSQSKARIERWEKELREMSL